MEPDLFEEIQRLRRDGRKSVLATIVQIRGSVPSFNTAKMLVRDDGSTLGSVGAVASKQTFGRLRRMSCETKNRAS